MSSVVDDVTDDLRPSRHHAARLAYANLPLVIGLASKNNTIAWMVSRSSVVRFIVANQR